MSGQDIKEYLSRDWSKKADLDRAYWAAEYRRNGPASTLKASQTLWLHMKSIRPDWPTRRDRKLDLENHIALKKLLDRIGNGLPSR
jgi:hypothetical protein